jgi:hypothetical protein
MGGRRNRSDNCRAREAGASDDWRQLSDELAKRWRRRNGEPEPEHDGEAWHRRLVRLHCEQHGGPICFGLPHEPREPHTVGPLDLLADRHTHDIACRKCLLGHTRMMRPTP